MPEDVPSLSLRMINWRMNEGIGKIRLLLCISTCHCWDQGLCKQFWALWLHFVIYSWIIMRFFWAPMIYLPLLVPNLVRLVGMVINQTVGAKKGIKGNTGSCLTRRNSKTWKLKLNFVFWLHFIYSLQSVFYLPVNLLRTSAIVRGENVLICCEKTDIWETFAFAYPCRVLTCCSKSNAKNSIWKRNIEIQWYQVVNVFILLQRPEVVLFFSSPPFFVLG